LSYEYPPPPSPPPPEPGDRAAQDEAAAPGDGRATLSTPLWVAGGIVLCAVLIAVSAGMTWYTSGADSGVAGTGSGFDLYRHRSELAVAPNSNPLISAFDWDGWYESFFGFATPILLAAALVLVGVRLALGRAPQTTLLAGLWLSLFSWLAAGQTGGEVSSRLGGLGMGIRVWAGASVAAAGIQGWALVRSGPSRLSGGAEWLAPVGVATWLPFALLVYDLEDTHPFANDQLLLANILAVGVPAAGAILGFEVVRARRRRPARLVAAILALLLSTMLWGGALYLAWVN
jgi:hypothetical protein